MSAPLILGVPSSAHREALLRETAGGGRVPMAWLDQWEDEAGVVHDRWIFGEPHHLTRVGGAVKAEALILSHPDAEAGAWGLARLAWVAGVVGWRPTLYTAGGASVTTIDADASELHFSSKEEAWWVHHHVPALRDATCAAEAIGLVCVHLGLLERVERVEVPHGG